MAEYKMSYNELQKFVDEAISNSDGDKEKLILHKAELLTALTGAFDDELMANQKEQNQLIELWNNQQEEKSQILLGKRYIRIHDGMLAFVEAFLTGGMCDAVLSIAAGITFPEAVTIGAASSVVIALVKLFCSAANLEDYDFCLYMQAVTHFRSNREFSKDDVISWYPINRVCNMHTSKWKCCHRDQEDKCGVSTKDIDEIMDSLLNKGVIKLVRHDEKKPIYKIKG